MALWRAVEVTVEGSHAFAAARRALADGASLPDVIDAWAAQTSSTADDHLAEQTLAAMRQAIDALESTGLRLVQVALRIEAHGPVVLRWAQDAVTWVERTLPVVQAGIDRARADLPGLVASTRDVASRLTGLSGRLRAWDGEP